MAIASKLQEYMAQRGLRYDVLTHRHSHSSMQTAHLAKVPGHSLAKPVVLEDDTGFIMAVLPSTHHVQLGKLGKELNCRLRLASEGDLAKMFDDCEPGAVPPVGAAYGMRMIVDDSLATEGEIYFEAGDHEQVIQMNGKDFMSMMDSAHHAHFGEPHWRH